MNPGSTTRRPDARFMLAHPAHAVALGFGAGLSPIAPGTVGTLWAWLAFLVLNRWLDVSDWAWLLVVGLVVGLWACTVAAQHLAIADPGAIVWDEVLAFWFVLWIVMPLGFWGQLTAFGLFRYFDAAKPGPVGWADRVLKPRAGETLRWPHGLGILLDDGIAALCTLLVMALGWRLAALW